jgi:uncharacterized protein (TIGR03435 family)
MVRPTLCAAAAILALQAQSSDPKAGLQFDVAVMKPTADRSLNGLIVHLPAETGYRGANMPLMSYLTVAYQVRPDQISGPNWLTTDNFDMEGKAGRTCTADELHQMLEQLLVERFHITLHRETKLVPGYSLAVDKAGSKMAEHDATDLVMMPIQGGPGMYRGKNVAMQYFAFYLSQQLGETVVNKTGLTGHYDFNVEWAIPPMPAPPPGGAEAPMMMSLADMNAGVFDALRKQLGLRLEKGKVEATQIVIDHIEKIAGN